VPAIGFGLAWFGYAVGLLGWCKVKGYTTGFGDLVRPGKAFVWPPPGGAAASSSSASSTATAAPSGTVGSV
jgi:hypothetical protein